MDLSAALEHARDCHRRQAWADACAGFHAVDEVARPPGVGRRTTRGRSTMDERVEVVIVGAGQEHVDAHRRAAR